MTLTLQRRDRRGQAAADQGGLARLSLLPRSRSPAAGARSRRGSKRSVRRCPSCRRRGGRGYAASLGLPEYDARVLTQDAQVADYFEAVTSAGVEPKAAANWVLGEVIGGWNDTGGFEVPPGRLAALIAAGERRHRQWLSGEADLSRMRTSDEAPSAVAGRLDLVQVRDEGALAGWVDEVLAPSPDELAAVSRRGDQADRFLRRAGHEEESRQGRSQGDPAPSTARSSSNDRGRLGRSDSRRVSCAGRGSTPVSAWRTSTARAAPRCRRPSLMPWPITSCTTTPTRRWAYPTSEETDALLWDARRAFADFVGGQPQEIVFGNNMTTISFHVARALARGWSAGRRGDRHRTRPSRQRRAVAGGGTGIAASC